MATSNDVRRASLYLQLDARTVHRRNTDAVPDSRR